MPSTGSCSANFLVAGSTPIEVLGFTEGTGFVGTTNSANNTTAAYVTGLKTNEVYRLTFFSAAGAAPADPIHIRLGGVVTTAAVTTSSFRWPCDAIQVLEVKLADGFTSIGFLASSTNAIHVDWVRLT